VSTGAHTCAILDNGDLKCWGWDNFGQLGDGGTNPTDTAAPSDTAIDLGTGRTAVAVSAGTYHTCAILDNGDLKCWGDNTYGQLGDGSTTDTNAPSSTAIDLGAGRTAVAVSVLSDHTCAILDNGEAKCWGLGSYGKLGIGGSHTAPSSTAIDLGAGRTAVALSAGIHHTCAILDNGEAKCWGYDFHGQLGDGGSNSNQLSPVSVSGSETWDYSTEQSSISSTSSSFPYANDKVSTGIYHSCAILDNGELKCWGRNNYGPLGDGTNTDTDAPSSTAIDLGTGRTAVAVSAEAYHTCAILDNSDLKCWGWNTLGQLGDGTNTDTNAPSSTVIDLGTGRTAVAVSAGSFHTCAILDNGDLKCWGYNNLGPLGDGTNTDTNAPSSTVIDLGTGRTAVAVSAGNQHTCAILDNGDLKCWGENTFGQLGDGTNTNTNAPSSIAIDLGLGRTAVAVSAGQSHTCAILDNGDLKCWGWDFGGQLGDGGSNTDTNAPLSTAIDLGAGRTAVAASVGGQHTCAILDNGDVKCWGRDVEGQLGNGGSNTNTNAPSSTAIDLGSGRTAVALSAEYHQNCAILDNGDLKCWGIDSYGQLGDGGSNTNQGSPVLVSGSNTWDNSTGPSTGSGSGSGSSNTLTSSVEGADISVDVPMTDITFQYDASAASGSSSSSSFASASKMSTHEHSCAILDNGDLKCWGRNNNGQLGDAGSMDRNQPRSTAIDLGTGRTAVEVSVGSSHTCAILDNGDLKCWGSGPLGLGSGYYTSAPLSTAIDLGTGRTAVAVSAGHGHTCAVLDNGGLKCWGGDYYGQLGDGGANPVAGNYVPLSSAIDLTYQTGAYSSYSAVEVIAGYQHTCAILNNGDLKCWGRNNNGQLGVGSNSDRGLPGSAIDLGTGRTAVAVAAGNYHTCAILDNGDLKCWGSNYYGSLGDGTNTDTNAPSSTAIDLGTGRTAVAVSAGHYHTCAILDNGDLKCWGENTFGQLGDGTNTNTNASSSTAIDLGTGRTAVAVSAGVFQTCAILDNGDAKCWGWDQFGQLGDGGSNTNQASPVLVSGSNTWDSSTGASSGASGMTNVTGATSCVASPSLPNGLNIDSSTCTISGTPTVETSNTTYTITAVISGITYEADIWLSTFTFGVITSTVDGAELQLGEAMTPITLNYTSQAPPGSFYSGNGSYWMTKDIRPQTSTSVPINQRSSMSSQNYALVSMGDFAYFAAYNGTVDGLWKSDGTESGTVLVKEHLTPSWMVSDGNSLYFHNGSRQLWMSDGTTSGTVLIKEFTQSNTTGGSILTNSLGVFANGLLFFVADDDNGRELWSTDGTTSGTQMVKDIRPGYPSSQTYNPYDGLSSQYLIVLGNHVYFGANDGTNGSELWKSDGTESGTVMVNDISSGSGDGFYSACATCMAVLDNNIYFSAYTAANGVELWKSDGTASGTLMVKDINTGTQSSTLSSQMVATEEKILFKANDGIHGEELWESDGTAAGTALLSEFTPTAAGSSISHMTSMGESAFFHVYVNGGGISYRAAFVSDGTPEGTFAVVNSSSLGYIHSMTRFTALGDQMYFVVNAPNANLYVSDGTTNGTTAITPFTGSVSTYNGNYIYQTPVIAGNTVLFASCTGVHPTLGTIGNHCHEGVELMAYDPVNITLNSPPSVSWETEPPLPAGMSISGGTISGTPSVYANNQTYTIYANQSGYSTTHELYFSVDNAYPHTVVEDQPIDAIGFHPAFWDGTTTWSISPSLPNSLSQDSATGEITGTVDDVMTGTYTVTASHSSGATETFTFSIESLLDTDGDGLPNDLPPTYNPANPPTSGLIADDDDDGDGLLDSVETDTGFYINGQDTGTDSLDPDTDGDGICDGPNAVPPVCIAGPDPSPNGNTPPPTLVGVNNTAIIDLIPYLVVLGGTFEISPDLPNSLSIDPNTGEITGTPTQTLTNTTFTVWSNHTDGTSLSWDFTIEILEDSDGDGMPNELPDDYDPTNPDSPGLIEDLDDDNDGNSDVDEAEDGTDPTNPDTDGDGMCDGPIAFEPDCVAGPDAFPLDPSADTDTDGDGDPDTLNPPSNSVPPLVEDLDDDGDGLDDVYETDTGIYNDATDTGTDPLDPDTDNDGICDGPNDVLPICVAGPDTELGTAIDGTAYLLNNTPMTYLMPKYDVAGAVYEVHPELPAGIVIDPVTGVISGTPTEITDNLTYTLFANVTADGFTSSWSFNMEVLEDTDGDGLPNELPDDYPTIGEAPFDLVEDLDDDGDGALDTAETGTGIFNGSGDMGTDPLDPDTDDDGICDGPNSVLPICIAGPDSNPVGTGPLGPTVLVNNTEMTPLPPANAVPGAIWAVSPDLPAGLTLDVNTGIISGTPT
jgi:ELWxxDGT repeat protein